MATIARSKFAQLIAAILLGAIVGIALVVGALIALPPTRIVYAMLLTEPKMTVLGTFLFSVLASARRSFWHGREREANPLAFAAGAFSGILTGMLLLFLIPALFPPQTVPGISGQLGLAQLGLAVVALQFIAPVIAAKSVFRSREGENPPSSR